jgi:hypothetical protein
MTPLSLTDLVMPDGWFCVNMSASGVGLYEKWFVVEKPAFSLRFGNPVHAGKHQTRTYRETTKYRVCFNGFCGGWTIQEKKTGVGDWQWFMSGVAFPSHVGAMLALEIELSNNKA